ncbi:MAG: zinc metallopeptidase [Lachnospiraceae bacterium]|nr:zinc metallopeptidase [Lachnospiraceae bacterium]
MYYGYGYGLDWTYMLVIIGAIISMIASARVQSTYARFAKVASRCGMTGAEVAQRILDINNVTDVSIGHVRGNLTDHFDPSKMVVNLSDATYGSRSVAALGVAAHECGHVMQHETGYTPLAIRSALVPIANFGSNVGIWIVMIGFILGLSDVFVEIGIVMFSFGVLFQLVTLPVEFDASHRALVMLKDYGILGEDEVRSSREVLKAAAMTYVAAAAASVLSLLRLIFLNQRRRRD